MSQIKQYGFEFFVHESGHLVIGHILGLSGQVVEYTGTDPEPFRAWYSRSEPTIGIKRSLAGLLAHVSIVPESLEKHLLAAYTESIILTPDHTHWIRLSNDEKEFMSGAQTDLRIAWIDAPKAIGSRSKKKVSAFLEACEKETRRLVTENSELILFVATEMKNWVESKDPMKDVMFSADTAIQAFHNRKTKNHHGTLV